MPYHLNMPKTQIWGALLTVSCKQVFIRIGQKMTELWAKNQLAAKFWILQAISDFFEAKIKNKS